MNTVFGCFCNSTDYIYTNFKEPNGKKCFSNGHEYEWMIESIQFCSWIFWMDELPEFQTKAIFLDVDALVDVRNKGYLDVMDENILWNAHGHDQKTLLWHSDWKLNCQICLFDVYCTSKLD